MKTYEKEIAMGDADEHKRSTHELAISKKIEERLRLKESKKKLTAER